MALPCGARPSHEAMLGAGRLRALSVSGGPRRSQEAFRARVFVRGALRSGEEAIRSVGSGRGNGMLTNRKSHQSESVGAALVTMIPRLDRIMADRKISVKDLAAQIDLAPINVSRIRTGNIKAIRLSTLERLCDALDCQPSDILEFKRDEAGARGYGFGVVPFRRSRLGAALGRSALRSRRSPSAAPRASRPSLPARRPVPRPSRPPGGASARPSPCRCATAPLPL